MGNIFIAIVLIAVLGGAAGYVYKAKKSGKKCIGCPSGGNCRSCSGCSGCRHEKG